MIKIHVFFRNIITGYSSNLFKKSILEEKVKKHWSCSKLADKVRGTKKPSSASLEEWGEWNIKAQKQHPVRYWIAETGLDKIQGILFAPVSSFTKIKFYILNRYKHPSHALVSNLKRGEWHELDERILHCLFDELVNFVEVDLAWHMIAINGGDKKYNLSKIRIPFFNTKRYPQAGYDYLTWAEGLVFEKNEPGHSPGIEGKPTYQAVVAQEVKNLYNWWKYERPQRKIFDEEDASMCSDKFDSNPLFSKDLPESAILSRMELEKNYFDEDTEMLIRLIRIRDGLWT